MNALIIEDEPQAVSALKQELSLHCPEITILETAQNVSEGILLIKKYQPDLIFLDIQLSDGLGFDILQEFDNIRFKIIFTTAYSQYALKAIKFSALDYLLKPIDATELKKAVAKATKQSQSKLNKKIELFLHNQKSNNKRIALQTSDGVFIHEVNTIIRCNSEGNYTHIHFTNGSKLLIAKTMKEFDELLSPYNFERIHHSHLINMNHLNSYVNKDGGYIVMSDKKTLPVAQRKKSEFLKKLGSF